MLHLSVQQTEMKINKTKNLYFCVASIKHFWYYHGSFIIADFSCCNLFSFWYILGKDLFFGVFPKENYSLENPSVTFIKGSLW